MANTISELQERAYRQSADKGFHDDDPTPPLAGSSSRIDSAAHLLYETNLRRLNAERIALIHSEASEALEELRNGKAANETYYGDLDMSLVKKPEGVPSEMADVVIRVLDFCGANGIDLEAIINEKLDYNATRANKHGGKKF